MVRRESWCDESLDGGFLFHIDLWLPIVCGMEDVRQGRVYSLTEFRERVRRRRSR